MAAAVKDKEGTTPAAALYHYLREGACPLLRLGAYKVHVSLIILSSTRQEVSPAAASSATAKFAAANGAAPGSSSVYLSYVVALGREILHSFTFAAAAADSTITAAAAARCPSAVDRAAEPTYAATVSLTHLCFSHFQSQLLLLCPNFPSFGVFAFLGQQPRVEFSTEQHLATAAASSAHRVAAPADSVANPADRGEAPAAKCVSETPAEAAEAATACLPTFAELPRTVVIAQPPRTAARATTLVGPTSRTRAARAADSEPPAVASDAKASENAAGPITRARAAARLAESGSATFLRAARSSRALVGRFFLKVCFLCGTFLPVAWTAVLLQCPKAQTQQQSTQPCESAVLAAAAVSLSLLPFDSQQQLQQQCCSIIRAHSAEERNNLRAVVVAAKAAATADHREATDPTTIADAQQLVRFRGKNTCYLCSSLELLLSRHLPVALRRTLPVLAAAAEVKTRQVRRRAATTTGGRAPAAWRRQARERLVATTIKGGAVTLCSATSLHAVTAGKGRAKQVKGPTRRAGGSSSSKQQQQQQKQKQQLGKTKQRLQQSLSEKTSAEKGRRSGEDEKTHLKRVDSSLRECVEKISSLSINGEEIRKIRDLPHGLIPPLEWEIYKLFGRIGDPEWPYNAHSATQKIFMERLFKGCNRAASCDENFFKIRVEREWPFLSPIWTSCFQTFQPLTHKCWLLVRNLRLSEEVDAELRRKRILLLAKTKKSSRLTTKETLQELEEDEAGAVGGKEQLHAELARVRRWSLLPAEDVPLVYVHRRVNKEISQQGVHPAVLHLLWTFFSEGKKELSRWQTQNRFEYLVSQKREWPATSAVKAGRGNSEATRETARALGEESEQRAEAASAGDLSGGGEAWTAEATFPELIKTPEEAKERGCMQEPYQQTEKEEREPQSLDEYLDALIRRRQEKEERRRLESPLTADQFAAVFAVGIRAALDNFDERAYRLYHQQVLAETAALNRALRDNAAYRQQRRRFCQSSELLFNDIWRTVLKARNMDVLQETTRATATATMWTASAAAIASQQSSEGEARTAAKARATAATERATADAPSLGEGTGLKEEAVEGTVWGSKEQRITLEDLMREKRKVLL